MTTEIAHHIVAVSIDDLVDDVIHKDDITFTESSKQLLENLGNSLLTDGQIHPISVRPHPDKPGKYLVVTGRKRLRAAKLKGIGSLYAEVIGFSDDIRIRGRILAENLHRSPINKAKHILQMQEWYRIHMQLDAERRGEVSVVKAEVPKPAPEAKAAEPPPKRRTREEIAAEGEFRKKVQESTGLSDTQARARIAIVKALEPEQLQALEAVELGVTDLARIAAVKDPEDRAKAVNLVVAGADLDEVLGAAKEPEPRPIPKAPAVQADGSLPDREYAAKYCSAIYTKLEAAGNVEAFVASVGLYRLALDHKVAFARQVAKPLAVAQKLAGISRGGAFTRMVGSLCQVTHPRDWLACTNCGGAGRAENPTGVGESRCTRCQGDGFRLNFDRG